MQITDKILDDLLALAEENPRKRQNYDLRTSTADTSQRMLNALRPGTVVPIHRHESTAETVVCLRGRLYEIIYEEVAEYVTDAGDMTLCKGFRETERHLLCPSEGLYGMQIQADAWHTIEVLEPSVIFEAKDGAYEPLRECDILK